MADEERERATEEPQGSTVVKVDGRPPAPASDLAPPPDRPAAPSAPAPPPVPMPSSATSVRTDRGVPGGSPDVTSSTDAGAPPSPAAGAARPVPSGPPSTPASAGRSAAASPPPQEWTSALPAPPVPPFAPGPEGRWTVALPSAVGRSVTIGVDPGGLTLGDERIPFEQIDQVRFKVDVGDALLHRAASARMSVQVTRPDGSTVRVAARNAASARKAEAIVRTLAYLWDLLGDTTGLRQRDDLVERIGRGGEVQVGGLRLTAIGIAWKRNPIVPWSEVGDPEVRDVSVVIPTDADPIVVGMGADDAFMLPSLVPVLRRRHG